MSRREELEKIVYKDGTDNKEKASQLIEEILFIEEQLAVMKKYPFIKVNPNDPTQQKSTPAQKIYKELMQQYNNSMRLLMRIIGDSDSAEAESPLRIWVKSRSEYGVDERQ